MEEFGHARIQGVQFSPVSCCLQGQGPHRRLSRGQAPDSSLFRPSIGRLRDHLKEPTPPRRHRLAGVNSGLFSNEFSGSRTPEESDSQD